MAGVLNEKRSFPFMDRGYINDANSTLEAGAYRCHAGATNVPNSYGTVIVFFATNNVVQIYIPSHNLSISPNWRSKSSSQDIWSDWKSF